jgi:hypothetical protein
MQQHRNTKKIFLYRNDCSDGLTYERPDFGIKHVKRVKDLKVGETFVMCFKPSKKNKLHRTYRNLFTVTSKPWSCRGKYLIGLQFTKNSIFAPSFMKCCCLTDMGIRPYENGAWHKNRWIERV